MCSSSTIRDPNKRTASIYFELGPPYFFALPALMMTCQSFSFSLQMYSNSSISRTSVSLMVLVQGFV